ncbi:MAG: hypothetical protein U9Q71_08585 [Pseudomonadota bacterium]|nr:hypothetical protein [Pseudomonadota bacterium]
MKQLTRRHLLIVGLAAAGWICNGEIAPTSSGFLIETAEARFGRPVTPVSVAGVARRTTRRSAGANLGGPVNRVGVR